MKTTALLYTAPNTVELADVSIPDPIPGEYVVQTLLTAISPGTELRNLSGQQPGVTYPAVGGYLNVGRIIASGAPVHTHAPLADGTLVFCSGTQKVDGVSRTYGGHIAHAITTTVYPLPANLQPKDAVLNKLAAIAYKGTRHSSPAPHESVAVVGLGPIGMLSLRTHALRGCRTIGFDVSPDRVAIARAGGHVAHVVESTLLAAREKHHPAGFDVVSDATGSNAVLRQTLALFRDRPWEDPLVPGLRLLIQGSYVGDISLPYMPAFDSEITVLFPRDNHPLDLRTALDLTSRGLLKTVDLISEFASPADAPAVYHRLASAKGPYLTAAFDWTLL